MKNLLRLLMISVILIMSTEIVLSQAAGLDATYATGSAFNGYSLASSALQPDGKLVVTGDFTGYNGTSVTKVARLNTDGTLDASFNTGTGPTGALNVVAMQPDGKILVGGWFYAFNGVTRNCIARLNSNGSVDATFTVGSGANNNVLAFAVQPDGKILVVGYFTIYNGYTCNHIIRLNTDGSRDATFNMGSGLDNYYIYSVAIQTDGKIVVGGQFTSYNGTSCNNIVRLNSDGSRDAGFNMGTGFSERVFSIVLQPDGKILAGGYFTSYNGTPRARIARLNLDGTIDNTFNNQGTGTSSSINSLALQADGKIVAGGSFYNYNSISRLSIERLNSDGSLDAVFDPGAGFNNSVNNVWMQSDGKILATGAFTTYNGSTVNRIVRLNGGPFPTSGLNFDGINDEVNCGNSSGLNLSGNFTIEAWVKPNSKNTIGSILSKRMGGMYQPGYQLGINSWNTSDGTIWLETSSSTNVSTSTSVTWGVWQHIAVVVTGSTAKIYLNGISQPLTNNNVVMQASNDPLLLGAFYSGYQFNGGIDEIRIWTRALCQSEIQNNMNCQLSGAQNGLLAYYRFNEGAGTTTADASGNGYNGTLNNFALSGPTSNWVTGNVSNTSCSPFVPPTATITPGGPTTFCAGGSVALNANTGTGYTYQWKNNGNDISGATGVTYSATASGSYSVVVTVGGCSVVSSATNVTLNPVPTVTATNTSPVCERDTLRLFCSAGISYAWTGPNNFSSTTQNQVLLNATTAKAGTYSVTITNANNCSATATTSVTVNSLPTVIAGSNGPVCSGSTLNLSGSGAVSYIWTGPNGFSSTGSAPTITNMQTANAGTYYVKGTGANGCRNDASTSVAVNPIPTITSTTPGSICGTGSVALGATASAGTVYWYASSTGGTSLGSGNSFTTPSLTLTTTYYVEASTGLCNSTSRTAVDATVNTLPTTTVTAGGSTTFCPGGSVTLSVVSGTGYTYQWKNNGVNITGETNATYTASASGSYSVEVTVNGCSATSSSTIVNADDTTAPTITCPGNKTIASCETIMPNYTSEATATDNCTAVVTLTQNPAAGTAIASGSTVTVTITAKDASNNTSTCSFTVTRPNITPVANNDAATVCAGSSVTINALGNDSHPQNAALTISDNSSPSAGTLVKNANNTFTYTAASTSPSTVTFTYTIKANDGVIANSSNNHYYEWVPAYGISWTDARTQATTKTFNGMQGYLVTVTSAAEMSFVATKLQGSGWMGASDLNYEGTWRWVTGPEGQEDGGLGRHFSDQFKTGTYSANTAYGINGYYANWAGGEPNDWSAPINPSYPADPNRPGEHYAHFYSTGLWNDYPNSIGGSITGYIVEYGGMEFCTPVLTSTATVTVTVNPKPVLNATTTNVICLGGSNGAIDLSVSSGTSPYNYAWSNSATTQDISGLTVGTYNVTVTDANSCSASLSKTINQVDNIAPTVNTQNITVSLNASGAASITTAQINNGSTDNCSIASYSLDKTSFTCSNVGANTVTLTVTDVNGNSNTGTATVTVQDNIAPTVNTQNVTVSLNASGSASITTSQINNGSTDNCSIASYSLDKTSFSCSNVGANTVTLTVTDVNGNSNTGTATVTVQDNVAPVVITKNISVNLSSAGAASITASQVNNGSSDACGIATLSVSPNAFTCSNVGANTVTLTVTDVNGNVSTGTATVTINDVTAPVVVTQNVSVTIVGGTASITAAQINNGSSDACGIASVTVSPSTFNCSNIGANTVTLTVTDVNGNTSTGTATVTVNGVVPSCSITSAPRNTGTVIGSTTTLAAPNQMFLGYGAQSMNITCTATGAGPFTYSWTGSGLSSTTIANPVFTPTVAGNYTLTCTATNSYGCQTTCSITICVINAVGTGGSPSNPKVTICHVPAGNPSNTQTLSIGVSAVPAHLGLHGGDKLGACNAVCGSAKTGSIGELYSEETINGDVDLIVYPNPSNSVFNFTLETPSDETISFRLFDMTGKVVMEMNNMNAKQVITVGNELSQGIYMAEVTQGEFHKVVKITKVN